MSAFPIVGCCRCRTCLCIGRRVCQSEHASKQRSGYGEHCGVVLVRRQQNAQGVGSVPPPNRKKSLRLPKSRPRNRGKSFARPRAPVARDPIAHVAGGGGLTTASARARGSELVMLVMRLAVLSNWLARSMQWPIASVISWIYKRRFSAGQVNRNGQQNQRQDATGRGDADRKRVILSPVTRSSTS